MSQGIDPDTGEVLAESFDSGLSLKQIAKDHKRTQGSIASRLLKLGKLVEQT